MTTFSDLLNQSIAGWNFNSSALRSLLQALLKYLRVLDVDIETVQTKEEPPPALSSDEKVDELQLQNENLKKEIEELRHKNKTMETELQELHHHNISLKEDVMDFLDQFKRMKEEMFDFCTQLKELKGDMVDFCEQNKLIKAFMEEFRHLNENVQDELKKLHQVGGSLGDADRAMLSELVDELNDLKALADNFMRRHQKMEDFEERLLKLEAANKRMGADLESKDLRNWVQKLEEDVEQLKAAQGSPMDETAVQHLQNQLDDLQGLLEDIIMSLTCGVHSDQEDQPEEEVEDFAQSNDRTALTARSVKVGIKLKLVFEHFDLLQDKMSNFFQQQQQQPRDRIEKEMDMSFVNDVQEAFQQLQAECGKLSESTRCLHEENRQKQNHIEALYNQTAMLEKKSNQQEAETKTKVNRQEFDAVTEQLHSLLNGLLEKMTVHEQDWLKFVADVHKQMENKLDRMELDKILRKKLKARWKELFAKLQAETGDERDAACVKKKLLETFRCLSCDRPTVMSPHWQKLPCYPSWTPIKTSRPFSAWEAGQLHDAVMAGQPKSTDREMGKFPCSHGSKRGVPHDGKHPQADSKIPPKLDGIKVESFNISGNWSSHEPNSPTDGKATVRSRRGSHKSGAKVYNKYELPVRTTKMNIKTKDPPTTKLPCARCFACSVKDEPASTAE